MDLRIVDTDKFCYIMTYSFPCQDLSVAGKQKGMTKGSGTRSGLLWEVERLLNECEELPQVLLMENVPQVHSKANMPDFQKWIDFLEGKGYSNYWQNLNAKDYGVVQNRDRCFMVSLLGEWNYKFPQPIPLKRKLKDYLEDEVDEKYYINTEKAQKLIQQLIENGTLDKTSDFEMEGNFNQRGKVHGEESVCRTIMGGGSHCGNEPKILSVGNVNPGGTGINGNVYAGDLSPTITTNKGEGAKICVDLSQNNPNKKRVSNCITTRENRGISNQQSVGNGVIEWKKEILGSVYTGVSEDFQRGICPIARTVKAEQHDLVVVETNEVKQIGNIVDSGNWDNPQRGRIYSDKGLCPALNTVGGGNLEPKIIVAMRGRNPDNPSDRNAGSPTEQRLESNCQGICNTLTSVQKDNMVLEKAILTPKRTEYGKSIRKAYESGEIKESRYNMTELEPRTDGISNTLTTVQKDNLVLENVCINDRGFSEKEPQVSVGTAPTLRAETHGNLPKIIETQYRIRKLTPLECWRLMGFSDEDFYKAQKANSNSQLYKQAGNSIVKNVLVAIFEKML